MKIGFIGLGKMGLNMVTRLRQGGHDLVVNDISESAMSEAVLTGASAVKSVPELLQALPSPKIVWVMVPSGHPTELVIANIANEMGDGDIIIDGGNSNFHDTRKRAAELHSRGIFLIDAGTSGGVWGLEKGYCLMVGGDIAAFKRIEPIMKTLAPENGYLHVGLPGSGHYVKMIHNGIEYGMMQAYAEGFEILKSSEYPLDLPAIADLWQHGSVVRSWLLELTQRALAEDPNLEQLRGYVADSGEGRWTVKEAIDRDVPAVVLTYALMTRFRSRQENSFADRLLAALRNQFGGHAVREK